MLEKKQKFKQTSYIFQSIISLKQFSCDAIQWNNVWIVLSLQDAMMYALNNNSLH